MALGLWGITWPEPYLACVILLAIAPLVALVLAGLSDSRLSLGGDDGPGRPSVAQLFLMPALALGVRGLSDVQLVDIGPGVAAAAAIAIVFAAAALVADERLRRIWMAAVVGLVGLAYGWGLVGVTNMTFDAAEPRFYRADVVRKWEAGGRHTDYNLQITPTGPLGVGPEVEVGWGLYEAVSAGDEICVGVFPGALGWRWYDVGFCPA